MKIQDFRTRKRAQQKISLVTCYDYLSATLVHQTPIDAILVGDSVAMVVHGHPSTLQADMSMMRLHIQAVARGAPEKFIIGDMPFCSYRQGRKQTVNAAAQLMCAGATAIKLEGAPGNLEHINHLVHSGIPVMGHLGLTPQSVHVLGGFKIQGKEKLQADLLLQQAQQLETAGCFALVLECIPPALAKNITETLTIPTIGIGAGPHTDGQVLVWHDMLGLNPGFKPKFLKTYSEGFAIFANALKNYDADVKSGHFPSLTTRDSE